MRGPRRVPGNVRLSASTRAALAAVCVVLAACDPGPPTAGSLPPQQAERALELMDAYGCGTCHVVPGLRAARGKAGPPLEAWAERTFIAGAVPNTPDNLVRWIVDPDLIEPGTAMPDLGVSPEEAGAMAAYLFSLRSPQPED